MSSYHENRFLEYILSPAIVWHVLHKMKIASREPFQGFVCARDQLVLAGSLNPP